MGNNPPSPPQTTQFPTHAPIAVKKGSPSEVEVLRFTVWYNGVQL